MPSAVEAGAAPRRKGTKSSADSGVHRAAFPCYDWLMRFPSKDLLRYRLGGVGAVLLVGIAHSVHDLLEGDPALHAFLPSISIVLQVATLSLGYGMAQRRGWSRRRSLGLAILVSMLFGCMTVILHGWRVTASTGFLGFWFLFAGIVVLGIWFLMFYFPEQLYEARTQALTAESERRKAELSHLRSNLHPHFILNTLNAVAGLLVSEPRQARQLVSALGDLLRDALEESDMMRPLGEEVGWLRSYAEIFEIRYRDAIRFEWDLSDDTLAMPVPRLLLQPLIENAITHGALQHPGGGTVTVHSHASRGTIHIAVKDDGPGMASACTPGLGLGLVRDRLQLAFPGAKMEIDSTSAGTSVTLALPATERSR